MRLPVACIQICVADGISAMQHFSITDINPAMAHARRIIGAFKEHQITGFGRTGRRTDVIEPLGSQPAHIPAGVIDNPRNVPRAIKGSGGRTAAPHIVIGNPLMLSPDFPPLHTVHATFTAHGVPSLVILTIYYNLPCSFLGVVFPEFLLNLLSGAERSAFPFASY